jgi:hypothetical protein
MRTLTAVVLALSVAAPTHARRSITVHVPAYTVPPRSDREVCTFVKLPGTHALDISGIDVVNLGIGGEVSSHHFIVYAYSGTDMAAYLPFEGKVVDSHACINFGPGDPTALQYLGATQTPRAKERYGQGLALQIQPTPTGATMGPTKAIGLILNSHWINGSDQPHTARVRLTLTLTAPTHVKHYLKPIFEVVANAFLDVPPGEVKTTGWRWGPGLPDFGKVLGGTTSPTGPACVTSVTGHMHIRGKLFTVDYVDTHATSTRLYTNTVYNEPGQTVLNPPLLVSTGEQLTYQCTHDNGVTTAQKMGCEEVGGTPPGVPAIGTLDQHKGVSGAAHRCAVDADCAGIGTGHCVPANLVFGFTSDDDMCILPGYYFDADTTKPAGHECDL